MKCLKMLGFAAVTAMALTAFAASTASAVTVCTANETTNCTATNTIEEVKATLVGSAILKSGTTTLDTCTKSEVRWTQEVDGAGKNASGKNDLLSWENCTRPTATKTPGSLEIDGKATVTGKGSVVEVSTIFGKCDYGTGTGTDLGTLAQGHTAKLSINTTIHLISDTTGFDACPTTATWTATYHVTNHTEVFISAN